jgi:hypothetical protein
MQLRQGDVFLRKIDKIPENAKEKDNILAQGETTGHKHKIINGKVFSANNQQYVLAEQKTELAHEEHGEIEIPEGSYEVKIQREYNPIENRQVMD